MLNLFILGFPFLIQWSTLYLCIFYIFEPIQIAKQTHDFHREPSYISLRQGKEFSTVSRREGGRPLSLTTGDSLSLTKLRGSC